MSGSFFRFGYLAGLFLIAFISFDSTHFETKSCQNQGHFSPIPPFAPNSSCSNFFLVMTDAGGLGHRIGSIVYALHAAKESKSAIAIHETLWSEGRWPDQGRNSLMFLRRLLDLRKFYSSSDLGVPTEDKRLIPGPIPTKWGSLTVVHSNDIDDAKDLAQSSCNLIIEARTGYRYCKNRNTNELDSCAMDSINKGSWEAARPIFRMLYEQGQIFNLPLTFFESYGKAIIISWHVRNGDISLNTNPEFWRNLVHSIESTIVNVDYRHYLFSERDLNGGPFEFLHSLFKFSLLTSISPELSIHHMANSDILVSTGSSFSITAALLAQRSQIHFYSEPKEGGESSKVYALSESIPILSNGSLSSENVSIMKSKFSILLRKYS